MTHARLIQHPLQRAVFRRKPALGTPDAMFEVTRPMDFFLFLRRWGVELWSYPALRWLLIESHEPAWHDPVVLSSSASVQLPGPCCPEHARRASSVGAAVRVLELQHLHRLLDSCGRSACDAVTVSGSVGEAVDDLLEVVSNLGGSVVRQEEGYLYVAFGETPRQQQRLHISKK